MKLIDLLVQELPKRGGWPQGVDNITQFPSGELCYNGENGRCVNSNPGVYIEKHEDGDATNWAYGTQVTREQYEAAMQQTAWNGDGLPPVGCDVEFILDTEKYSVNGIIPENGQTVNVVAHKVTTDDNLVAVVYWDDNGAGRAAAFIKQAFRPIRAEAERKRDDFAKSLADKSVMGDQWQMQIVGQAIYDAIAAGKIPGVKLETN